VKGFLILKFEPDGETISGIYRCESPTGNVRRRTFQRHGVRLELYPTELGVEVLDHLPRHLWEVASCPS
jgi:hypothetical protein